MGLPLVANGRFWAGMNRCTLITAIKGEGLVTEDIGYYDYRPVTLLFACFISFQRYALS